MNANRLFPGMCDDSQEFFFHEDRNEVFVISKSETRSFFSVPCSETSALDDIIDNDIKLRQILNKWFPKNRQQQKNELAKCRFGGLNLVPDISACRTTITPDYRACKLFGKCEGEGIVCQPLMYNTEKISNQEVETIKLLSTGIKNHEVAKMLNMALGTFYVFKSNLYDKLNTHNKQDLSRVAVKLGIC